MRMVRYRTESVCRRYAVVDEAMLREGTTKLHALHVAEGLRPAPANSLERVSTISTEA
jgi:hypothetical protein